MRGLAGWIAVAVAVGALWLLVPRSAPSLPTATGAASRMPASANEVARGETSVADAAVPAGEGARTAIADPLPSVNDFASEQREAVREILAMGQPDATEAARVRTAMAQLEADDFVRRAMLERELLASAAIVSCDVLAVGNQTVTVRCLSRAPEVGAEVGSRCAFRIGSTPRQAEILQRHHLAEWAIVERGRRQTLLLSRTRLLGMAEDHCVLAGPPRGDAAEADEPLPATRAEQTLEQQLMDFEPAARAAVRELLTGGS